MPAAAGRDTHIEAEAFTLRLGTREWPELTGRTRLLSCARQRGEPLFNQR